METKSTKDVHEALKSLSPTDHGEFPSDSSTLRIQIASSLVDTHTLISSIPPPSVLPENIELPEPVDADSRALQNEWKPVKVSTKENPLGISVFKLAAKDGKGSWFARRSIHTEIPFHRFKVALQKEFEDNSFSSDESETGRIRGIGKDSRIRYETCDLGTGEIFQLSAQFPGPSAPREFIQARISTSAHPEDLSAAAGTESSRLSTGANGEPDVWERPNQFTAVSKPILNHPECNERQGYVRGNYESVEFIREIPLSLKALERSQSTPTITSLSAENPSSRPRGKSVGSKEKESVLSSEHYPVDWIMITRSDPGGSVPKWMVERGTPGGIVKDAEKFLKWCINATHLDKEYDPSSDSTVEEDVQRQNYGQNEELQAQENRKLAEKDSGTSGYPVHEREQEALEPSYPSGTDPAKSNVNAGFFASALSSVTAGVSSLAQSAMSSSKLTPPSSTPSNKDDSSAPHTPQLPKYSTNYSDDDDDDDDDANSVCSFATCESEPSQEIISSPSRSRSSTTSSLAGNSSKEDRSLAHFLKEKLKLEEKSKKEEGRRTDRERKLMEKHMKNLEKQERKYQRAVEKAQQKQKKEQEKREQEFKKKLEPEIKGKLKEMDNLRRLVESLTKENIELRLRIEELANGHSSSSTNDKNKPPPLLPPPLPPRPAGDNDADKSGGSRSQNN